jgi:hypothetical protein
MAPVLPSVFCGGALSINTELVRTQNELGLDFQQAMLHVLKYEKVTT